METDTHDVCRPSQSHRIKSPADSIGMNVSRADMIFVYGQLYLVTAALRKTQYTPLPTGIQSSGRQHFDSAMIDCQSQHRLCWDMTQYHRCCCSS